MKAIYPLVKSLKCHLKWNQARIDFLSKFLVTLLRKESVNLTKIAKGFPGKAEVSSHYRRLNRFFEKFEIDFSQISLMLVSFFNFLDQWILCLDRTNWKFGKLNINILMLSIAYEGIAIPVIWVFLPKRGNSNSSERIDLMNRFIQVHGKERIVCLTADREFIGQDWLPWLKENQIPYCIRIRKNIKVPCARGSRRVPVFHLFRGLAIGESMILKKQRTIMGVTVFIIGLRIEKEWVLLITDHCPQKALEYYKKRWQIETLFGCLKSRGFNLEETHLNRIERISKMVALLAIAFCWAYKTGIYRAQLKPIPIKKHGRKAFSLFRIGLDWLNSILFNLTDRKNDFRLAIQFLSST